MQTRTSFPYPHKDVTSAKETPGSACGLAVDAGPGYMPQDALKFARAVEKLNLLWIEDSITGD
ncbi:hypothetical protein R5H30_15685, partial [Sulfitobacter sp. D35]|nr:hypothetical protein [Sulfitobacter sp. D35]